MTALAAVALIVAALLFVGWRIERIVERRTDRELALEERKLAVEERRLTSAGESIAIPAFLMTLAESESEDWAKEQVKGRMRELYADTKNWETVAHLIAQEMHQDGPIGSA